MVCDVILPDHLFPEEAIRVTLTATPKNERMTTQSFLKEKVTLFRDFSSERLQALAEGSRVTSFEANEAIMGAKYKETSEGGLAANLVLC